MASAANFLTVTPLVPTSLPLAEALNFYTDQLGFTVTWQAGTMAGIRRGGVEFNLIESSDRNWADNASFSIGVADLDALCQEYQTVTTARIGPLEMKPWGRREFHLIDPSGVCFQFYERG